MAISSLILYASPTMTPPDVSAQNLAKQSSTSYWGAQTTAGREKELEFKGTKQCSLLFTQKGTDILTTYIQETGVATRQWLLQGSSENQTEDCWGWGSLGEERVGDGEALE